MPLKKASSYYYPQQKQTNIEELLGEINANLEKIATNLDKLTALLATYLETVAQLQAEQVQKKQGGYRGYGKSRRGSAMEILADEKIVFASDLVRGGKIRNINKFIASMKRRGAIIFETENEVAIVDADFARELVNEINGFSGSEENLNEHLIEKFGDKLGDKIQKLIKILRDGTYIIMTPSGKWKFTVSLFPAENQQKQQA